MFISKGFLYSFLPVPFFPYAFLAFIAPLFQQLGNLGAIFLKQSLNAKQTNEFK